MRRQWRRSAALLVALWMVSVSAAPARADAVTESVGAVATAHPLATEAGVRILAEGGNAFDAAVAIAATLGVVEPTGSGLGGGGFFLLHEAQTGRKIFVDARETAPAAIRAAMYLDADGKPQRDLLRAGPLAAGIPGLPAGLVHLARTRGSLPLNRLLEPAIRHARDGFEVDAHLAARIAWRAGDLGQFPASADLYVPDGKPLAAGARLVQRDLASTLSKLATFGTAGFYEGPVADEMLRSVREAGGVWSAADLRGYQVIERRPVILGFGDWQIVSAPPPSSGGLVLGEVLHMLDLLGYRQTRDTSLRTHMLVEAMRRAYFDRALYMGDDDFVPVPSRQLLSQEHARMWLEDFDPERATASADLAPEPIASVGLGTDTTHFSVLDAAGNRVAATLSINFPLGAAFIAGRTGVMLNNEMDDFVIQPGVPNGYELVGGEANLVAPGKRMLSSMSPTFLEGAQRTAILGTPGGSRIITMVLLALLDLMEGASADEAVSRPRFHHQYLPDEIQHEPAALSADLRRALVRRGHELKDTGRDYGNMQLILIDHATGVVSAASDPRGIGQASIVARPAPVTRPTAASSELAP